MKILLISWVMLVLGVSLNSGHYIYKVEKEDAPSYEVKSNPRGLVLVNTRLEEPTLKDILYQSLIELFFGKEDPLITERAFTNSHGLPFLEDLDDGSDAESTRARNDDEIDDEMKEESEPKPLTDEAVKEAYKSKSYLFDQMRQRNDAISPDFFERKKRQSEMPYFPEAPQISSDAGQDPYAPPRTYGMNLNPDGGYVWNNLNNPSSMYELGQPQNGYQNPDQYQPSTPSETRQPEEFTSSAAPEVNPPEEFPAATPENSYSGSSEDIFVNNNKPTSLPSDSGSSEDIFVNINKPTAQPSENLEDPAIEAKDAIPEVKDDISTENPIVSNLNEKSGAIERTDNVEDPSIEAKDAVPDVKDDISTENPIAPNINENPDFIEPTNPIIGEARPEQEGIAIDPQSPIESVEPSQESKQDLEPAPVQENPEESAESSSIAPIEEIVVSTEGTAENPEGDQIKEMPEAPTLPPLNYDNLPDYVRQAISSTEKTPIGEDVLATAQPVEDIPRTYGMNLTSGSGKVWNDLVNPPVSYEVGSPDSNRSEEPKETTTRASIIEDPVTGVNEPAEPTNTEVPAIPEDTVSPTDIPEVPEQPENPPNEPELQLPETEPENEENNPNTDLPQEASTTETPKVSESTEPEVKAPGTEVNNEENILTTELPEVTSTTQILDTVAPVTEPANVIISTTEALASVSEEIKSDDGNIEPVVPVTPADDPGSPEIVPESGSGETSDETEDKVSEPEAEKEDVMSELLKSEQFWKWLGEWMVTYTELMEKHIRKIAIQEICNHSRQGNEMCPLDKPEDSGSIIKDGKVTINGNEIDVKDNLNQLKRNNPNKGSKVDATTIYGNSVGNEKVTNVFIFNPNNAKDILEGLKPDNDKVNIIIEDHNKEEIKGKSEEIGEEVTEIPEEDKDSTEDAGIEDRETEQGVTEIPEENKDITEDAGIDVRGTEVPKVESITAVSEDKPNDIKDEIVSEDVKEVENVTEAVLGDETTLIADVKEVTTVSGDLSKANDKEVPLKL